MFYTLHLFSVATEKKITDPVQYEKKMEDNSGVDHNLQIKHKLPVLPCTYNDSSKDGLFTVCQKPQTKKRQNEIEVSINKIVPVRCCTNDSHSKHNSSSAVEKQNELLDCGQKNESETLARLSHDVKNEDNDKVKIDTATITLDHVN